MDNQDIREEPPTAEDLDARLVGELDISIEEVIDEVLARSAVCIPAGAFTIRQFTDRHPKITRGVARGMLERQVESGYLSGKKINNTWYYWKA